MKTALPDFLHPVSNGIPVIYCGRTNGPTDPEHSIVLERGFHFVLCTGGRISVAELDIQQHEREHPMHEGDMLLLSPSRTATLQLPGADDALECISLDPDYFDTLPDGQPLYNQLSGYMGDGRTALVHLEQPEYEALRHTASLFFLYPNGGGLYDEDMLRHLCSLYLLQTAQLLYRHRANAPAFVKRPNEIFRNFKRLAVKNYRSAHDIAFYAARLHISPTYLSRIVKQVTGRTVRAHLAELLCSDARRLLNCSDLDIKEIADTLGFSDQSAFGKFFVRQTGCSPLRFRREKTAR